MARTLSSRKLNGGSVHVERWVKQHLPLQICGDIANQKKHGLKTRSSHSGLWPRLASEVTLDLRKNGKVELAYDGARKQGWLYVTNPEPIPMALGIYLWAGEKQSYHEPAAVVVRRAMKAWKPLLSQLGILTGADPEAIALEEDMNALPQPA